MNILVTGGAGFIGSTVADAYVKQGHQVFVIDDESSGKKGQVNSKARYAKISVNNEKALARLFNRYKFDVVNHHAAQIDVRKSVENPQLDAKINILGILNLLSLSREHKVKKFIFASSGGTVYGECRRPAREGDPEVPLSPYGIAKLASEKYIQAFSHLYGMKYTIFRYANVYGPRQDPHGEAGVVAIFSNLFLSGKHGKIFGSGKQTRDFVYVKDVANANVRALNKGHNQVLNVGTAQEVSVLTLYTAMARAAGFQSRPIFKKPRLGELNRSVLDYRKIKKVLGWRPTHSLHQGLTETLRYFKGKPRS